jgi:hypothetical protein
LQSRADLDAAGSPWQLLSRRACTSALGTVLPDTGGMYGCWARTHRPTRLGISGRTNDRRALPRHLDERWCSNRWCILLLNNPRSDNRTVREASAEQPTAVVLSPRRGHEYRQDPHRFRARDWSVLWRSPKLPGKLVNHQASLISWMAGLQLDHFKPASQRL